jgi:hypothetical protein
MILNEINYKIYSPACIYGTLIIILMMIDPTNYYIDSESKLV